MPTKTVTQEVIKEVPKEVVREVPKEVVKEVEVDKNHAVWLQLVSVDDQILGVASKGFMDVSTALTQYANGNMNAFSDLSVNLNLKVATITKLSTQRHTLLNQLGVE